eukprot:6588179-Pyramimonas_sp.AAC.1
MPTRAASSRFAARARSSSVGRCWWFYGANAEMEHAFPLVGESVDPRKVVVTLFRQLGHEPSWSSNAAVCTKRAYYSTEFDGKVF